MATTRRTFTEKQKIELATAFLKAGATTRDASEIIRHDWLAYEMMTHGRSFMNFHVSTDELDLSKELDEKRFFGTEHAFRYFGVLFDDRWYASLQSNCATLCSQLRMMEAESAKNRIVFWMPPLSLNDMIAILPSTFFDIRKGSFLHHAGSSKANGEKMAPGFRMLKYAQWEDIESEGSQCRLTELAYVHALLSLTNPGKEIHHAGTGSYCQHGERDSLPGLCMFHNRPSQASSPFSFYNRERAGGSRFSHYACQRYPVAA